MNFAFTGKKLKKKTFAGFTLLKKAALRTSDRKITVAGDSHPGLVRTKNEDSFIIHNGPSGAKRIFAAVADGIGSIGNGDLASRLCLQQMTVAWRKFCTAEHSSVLCSQFLNESVEKANILLRETAENRGFEQYMGTTIASLMISGKLLFTAHAGDSRIYRLRDGILERLTRDHTVVETLIASGQLTPEEASCHPMAHVISRAVGIQPRVNPELQMFDLQDGDRYLLCSDGLYLHLNDQEIGTLLDEALSPKKAVQLLLGKTIQRGAEDNVTLLSVFT